MASNPVDTTAVSQDPTHQEGIDHIKGRLDERSASNPTTDASTAGTTSQSGGIIDTVKSYLGYSNTGTTEPEGASSVSSTLSAAGTNAANTVSSGLTSAAALAGLTPQGASSTTPNTATATTSSSPSNIVPETERENSHAQTHGAAISETRDPATNAKSNPSAADTADTEPPSNPAQDTKPKPASSEGGPKLENKSAIPTAGGQRLGEKHWGESDVVPADPKNSTSAGQPTDEVKSNTAKNTGSAASEPQPAGKESALDKLKDKLPFHKKD